MTETKHLKALADDHFRNAERLAALCAKKDIEIATLKAELLDYKRQELWDAYSKSHEKDGRWTHLAMCDGEWLVRMLGFDVRDYWYDADTVKTAIKNHVFDEEASQ